jgi:hypothetical protein
MNTKQNANSEIDFIRELCKHKNEAEILEAEENFRRYLLLIKRICERLEQEGVDINSVDELNEDEII